LHIYYVNTCCFGRLVAWLKVAEVGHDMDDFEVPDGFERAPYQPEMVYYQPYQPKKLALVNGEPDFVK